MPNFLLTPFVRTLADVVLDELFSREEQAVMCLYEVEGVS